MADIDVRKLERPIKALANRRRLMMVRYIKKHREVSVTDIAHSIPLSIKATSKHLGLLVAADILEREQRSVQMFYRLSKEVPEPARMLISLL